MIGFEQGLIVFAVAAVVTYAMVPVSKRIAVFLGAIDYPSNRRVNKQPIPRCGGIALYCGFLAGCFTVYVGNVFYGWGTNDLFVLQDIDFRLLFVGMTFMFCVGLVDDIVQLSPPSSWWRRESPSGLLGCWAAITWNYRGSMRPSPCSI